jgi:hypothetical protein
MFCHWYLLSHLKLCCHDVESTCLATALVCHFWQIQFHTPSVKHFFVMVECLVFYYSPPWEPQILTSLISKKADQHDFDINALFSCTDFGVFHGRLCFVSGLYQKTRFLSLVTIILQKIEFFEQSGWWFCATTVWHRTIKSCSCVIQHTTSLVLPAAPQKH